MFSKSISSTRLSFLAVAALTAGTVSTLSNTAHATLVHEYLFTNQSGTANDSVGNAGGVLAGGATVSGGHLNTSNTHGSGVQLPLAATAGVTGDFTIEDWASFDSTALSDASYNIAWSFGNSQSSYISFVTSDATANQMYLALYNSPSTGYTQLNTTQVTTNTMNMFAITYTAATGAVKLYVDGSAASAGTAAGFDLATVAGNYSGGTGAEDGIGYFGAFLASPSAGGTTGDFRIYNDAQTSAQVLADYRVGLPVPAPAPFALLAVGGLGVSLLGNWRARAGRRHVS